MALELQFSNLPYPGLRPYRFDESDIFFGRERQTDQLLARLARCRFLAVTGASGCGKSSLVKAGMIPALNAGFMAAAGSRWRICEMRPGDRPLRRLTEALAHPEFLGARLDYDEFAAFTEAALRRGPLGLIEIVDGAETLRSANLLVLVDQFEEIFRHRERIAVDEADAFVALLLASARQSDLAIYIVVTMRSDYLGACAVFHGLPEAVSESQYLTPRLTREEVEQAIAGPARVFDGRVDPKLVNRLINDFGTDSDQLPLLQHALARLWARCATISTEPTLTVEEYVAIGGLANALSNHGDEIYGELAQDQQRIAEIMFKRLCGSEDGRHDIRSPARVDEVARIAAADPQEVIAVAEAFRRPDRCFLAAPEERLQEDTALDLSHESLIRQWRKLADWAAQEAVSAEMYRRLRDSALRWDHRGAELWRGADLASAIAWQGREHPNPDWAERYRDPDQPQNQFELSKKFLAASEEARAAALVAEEARRQGQLQRARRAAWVSGFAAACLVAMIVGYYMAYGWKHDTYYKDYVKVWGVPQGIGKLSAAEAAHRSRSYKITTEGLLGHVLSMEAVNALGQPVNGIHTVSEFSPSEDDTAVSRLEYGYDPANQYSVAYEASVDRQQHLISRVLYSSFIDPGSEREPGQRQSRKAYVFRSKGALARQAGSCAAYLKYEYSDKGYETLIHYLDRAGNPTPGMDNAFSQARFYDNDGRLQSDVSLDRDNKPMNDRAGNSEMRREYDKAGNMAAAAAFDAAGQAIDLSDPDNNWQRLMRKYDDRGNIVAETLWHANGAPAEDGDGCHSKKLIYNERGNIVQTLCLQSDDQPKEKGYTTWEYKYDENDRLTQSKFFDRDGRPIEGPDGAAQVRQIYDEDGHVTETAFFDEDEKPTQGNGGYHKEHITVDENGHPIRTEYLDSDGKLTPLDAGYAAIDRRYDGQGNEVRTTYLDANNQPVADRYKHWAIKKAAYDACGREIDVELSDKDDQHPALVKKTYDDNNNVKEEICEEQPSCSSYQYNGYDFDGYARVANDFDRNGNRTDEGYFDANNQPVVTQGYAKLKLRYDDHNELLEEAHYGANRQLVLSHGGWARVTYLYDERRREVEEAYFGIDGKPVMLKKGYAKVTRRYDGHDAVVEEAYFGMNGGPVLSDEGWARVTYRYDDHRRRVEEAYFGIDGKPMMLRKGYAKVTRRYDGHDAVVEEAYFGVNGEPVLSDEGWARITYVNDERGRAVERAHFGVRGEPVIGKSEQYHRATRHLDDRGNMLELTLFGTDGNLLEIADSENNRRCARFVNHYDANDQQTGSDCFDAGGSRVIASRAGEAGRSVHHTRSRWEIRSARQNSAIPPFRIR